LRPLAMAFRPLWANPVCIRIHAPEMHPRRSLLPCGRFMSYAGEVTRRQPFAVFMVSVAVLSAIPINDGSAFSLRF
jgi:hypothetical protein